MEDEDQGQELPLLAEFSAVVRRPKPQEDGMIAELFAVNGKDADAVMALGRSNVQDALADVDIRGHEGTLGGFQAYVRRPVPLVSGMVARFFGENGAAADSIVALSLSKYQDMPVNVTVRLVQLPDGAGAPKEDKPKGQYGDKAAILWSSIFLGTEEVWKAIGTDKEYLDWVRQQPCCIVDKGAGIHEGSIVPMHVRRIEHGAGERLKPPYSAIPGCTRHHNMQSDHGESVVGGRQYYDTQRVKHLRLWVWQSLKAIVQVESMADANPALVHAWARAAGVESLLPSKYLAGVDLNLELPEKP